MRPKTVVQSGLPWPSRFWYYYARIQFQCGDHNLNYIVRCWDIGDEEEWQVLDSPISWNCPSLSRPFQRLLTEALLQAKAHRQPNRAELAVACFCRHKVSAHWLYKRNDAVWANVFFAATDNASYKEYLRTYCEEV